MKHTREKLTEDDFRLLPPKLHLFLGAHLLMLGSASLGLLVLTHFFLNGSFIHTFIAIAIYALVACFFFMRIVYGYINAYKGLMMVAFVCMGLSTFNMIAFFNERSINSLATFGLILASLAIIIMRSKGYWVFLRFVDKRWSRYRETGVPLFQEHMLQMTDDGATETKKTSKEKSPR